MIGVILAHWGSFPRKKIATRWVARRQVGVGSLVMLHATRSTFVHNNNLATADEPAFFHPIPTVNGASSLLTVDKAATPHCQSQLVRD